VGLLDDAIREHLDLKRRRGADPAEIERAEREALGPVRRNRDPALAEDPEFSVEELDPGLGSALDEPDEGTASDLVEETYGGGPYGDPERGTAAADPGRYLDDEDPFIADEDEDLAARGDDLFIREDEPLAEEDDPHRTQLMSTVDIPPAGEPTAAHDVEEAFAQEDAGTPPPREAVSGEDEDDMLEETPEFLQDTPEHDRLWFEQRPPRDFDFDG
jgi:hypothetical protein